MFFPPEAIITITDDSHIISGSDRASRAEWEWNASKLGEHSQVTSVSRDGREITIWGALKCEQNILTSVQLPPDISHWQPADSARREISLVV